MIKEYISRARGALNESAETLPGNQIWTRPVRLKDLREVYEAVPQATMKINLIPTAFTLTGIAIHDHRLWLYGLFALVTSNAYAAVVYSTTKQHYVFDNKTRSWVRAD